MSVPILAGALLRLPIGLLSHYIGRKNTAMLQMSLVLVALVIGHRCVDSYGDVLAMGLLPGVAGASFGVALSLGAGSFPAQHKGLAMGIAGTGNSGTVLAVLFAPPLAQRFGWQAAYGLAAVAMCLPLAVVGILAKEPADQARQTLRQHLACLVEKGGWLLSLVYVVTFGGFIGLASFLPTYFHDQFGVAAIAAGQLAMGVALAFVAARARRPPGGSRRRREHAQRRDGRRGVLAHPVRHVVDLVAGEHAAARAVLLGPGRGQRRVVPAGALALAAVHSRGGVDDRPVGSLGWQLAAKRHEAIETTRRDLPLGLHRFRGGGAAVLVVMQVAHLRWVGVWTRTGGRAPTAEPGT